MSVGLKRNLATIDAAHLADRSLSVVGSIDSVRGSFVEALHLISTAAIPAGRLVSHLLPLEVFGDGFRALGCDIAERALTPPSVESCKILLAVDSQLAETT